VILVAIFIMLRKAGLICLNDLERMSASGLANSWHPAFNNVSEKYNGRSEMELLFAAILIPFVKAGL
jgi:hypothetical protein